MAGYVVTRDGRIVSRHDTSNDAWIWILNHQSQSVTWAMKHEGYAIRQVIDVHEEANA